MREFNLLQTFFKLKNSHHRKSNNYRSKNQCRPTLILTAVIIAFSVVTILQFKKRLQQIKFTHLLMILLIAQVLLLAFDVEQLRGVAGEGYMISYNVFTILPVLQIIFCRLATAGIKKDEALVRSADRLR